VLQGLYKFRFTTERGTGCGVMFATSGGRLYGGDSGSSFVGSFSEANGVVSCEVTMSRHYHDAKYVPMFEVEIAVMNFTGAPRGEEIHFEGGSAALPGVHFATILAPSMMPMRHRPVQLALTASVTGSIPSTSACSTVSMPATAVS